MEDLTCLLATIRTLKQTNPDDSLDMVAYKQNKIGITLTFLWFKNRPHSLEQFGQIAKSGSQTRLSDATILPTMLYSCNFLNLILKLDFNPDLTILSIFCAGNNFLNINLQ